MRCSGCGAHKTTARAAHMNDTTGLPLRRPRSRFGFGGVTSTPIMALRKNKRRVHEIIKFWLRCGARLLNDGAQLLSWKSARKRSPGGRGATARATLCTEAPAFRPMRLSHRQMYCTRSSRRVASRRGASRSRTVRECVCGYDAVGSRATRQTLVKCACVRPSVRPAGRPARRRTARRASGQRRGEARSERSHFRASSSA